MKKFKLRWIYRFQKPPIPSHICNRCGNYNRACPDCNGPTKMTSHDPQIWKCRKCKNTFTIMDFDDYD